MQPISLQIDKQLASALPGKTAAMARMVPAARFLIDFILFPFGHWCFVSDANRSSKASGVAGATWEPQLAAL